MRSVLRLLFSVLCAALLASCASTGGSNTVTLPALPAWQAPQDGRPLTAWEVQRAVERIAPSAKFTHADNTYTRLSHAWLERYVSWTWEAARTTGIRYTPESFDCDDFAVVFHGMVAIATQRAGVKAAPLVARLIVVGGDGLSRHELIGVATDRGLFVVEPQPAAGPFRITPLDRYPNKILAVILGDFNP